MTSSLILPLLPLLHFHDVTLAYEYLPKMYILFLLTIYDGNNSTEADECSFNVDCKDILQSADASILCKFGECIADGG